MKREIFVKIGEVKVGRDEDTLKATLGSCVGIAFLWKEKNIFGLAHCLLPDGSEQIYRLSARYVALAIPSLMTMMEITPADVGKIEVHIAGGGNMHEPVVQVKTAPIGQQNYEKARALLKEKGFRIQTEDVGGDTARQIIVKCGTAEVIVRKINAVSI
ncbi:chemotaxis protein CheD [Bdellovibrio sp. HCB337]|uniref:chemotaxis protein CheD n=1 Tax=Bdellovibrio sp. HCB337 TaxID=3394358 RepID=UPI0039A6751F